LLGTKVVGPRVEI
jgi:hypothetical protein